MHTPEISPAKYAKKAFLYLGLIDLIILGLAIGYEVYLLKTGKESLLFLTFVLPVILLPSLGGLTYLAFWGARKLKQNPTARRFSYYAPSLLITIGSMAVSLGFGWLLIYILPFWLVGSVALFLFFGGGYAIIPYFVILLIITLAELFIIKKLIIRRIKGSPGEPGREKLKF